MGLRVIGISEDIDFEGEGEILRVAEKPAPGARTFEIDQRDRRDRRRDLHDAPHALVIERTGPPASSRSPSTTGPIPTGRRRSSTS